MIFLNVFHSDTIYLFVPVFNYIFSTLYQSSGVKTKTENVKNMLQHVRCKKNSSNEEGTRVLPAWEAFPRCSYAGRHSPEGFRGGRPGSGWHTIILALIGCLAQPGLAPLAVRLGLQPQPGREPHVLAGAGKRPGQTPHPTPPLSGLDSFRLPSSPPSGRRPAPQQLFSRLVRPGGVLASAARALVPLSASLFGSGSVLGWLAWPELGAVATTTPSPGACSFRPCLRERAALPVRPRPFRSR